MTSKIFKNALRFVILILAQVAIFDHIHFLGSINPYPYVLFILLFPIGKNRITLLLFSFFLGLSMDMFSNSGGIHAMACTIAAYIRPWVLRSVFGLAYEYNTIYITKTTFSERFLYASILIFTHHLVLFIMETFNFSDILYILKQTLFSGVFTLILCLIFMSLFSRKRK